MRTSLLYLALPGRVEVLEYVDEDRGLKTAKRECQ